MDTNKIPKKNINKKRIKRRGKKKILSTTVMDNSVPKMVGVVKESMRSKILKGILTALSSATLIALGYKGGEMYKNKKTSVEQTIPVSKKKPVISIKSFAIEKDSEPSFKPSPFKVFSRIKGVCDKKKQDIGFINENGILAIEKEIERQYNNKQNSNKGKEVRLTEKEVLDNIDQNVLNDIISGKYKADNLQRETTIDKGIRDFNLQFETPPKSSYKLNQEVIVKGPSKKNMLPTPEKTQFNSFPVRKQSSSPKSSYKLNQEVIVKGPSKKNMLPTPEKTQFNSFPVRKQSSSPKSSSISPKSSNPLHSPLYEEKTGVFNDPYIEKEFEEAIKSIKS